MKMLAVLKGKLVLAILSGTVLVGGATAAFAATPAGQHVMGSISHADVTATVTVTATATKDAKSNDQDKSSNAQGKNADHKDCAGVEEAQNLATKYQLSTDSKGAAVMAFCTLHDGTFKGTTTDKATVTVDRVYGYGEVDQLLTYAKYLAAHDSANAGGKLTDANVSTYLADALKKCGTSPLEKCLKTNIPNYQPGNSDNTNSNGGSSNSNGGSNNGSNGSSNGNKPTATPTPRH